MHAHIHNCVYCIIIIQVNVILEKYANTIKNPQSPCNGSLLFSVVGEKLKKKGHLFIRKIFARYRLCVFWSIWSILFRWQIKRGFKLLWRFRPMCYSGWSTISQRQVTRIARKNEVLERTRMCQSHACTNICIKAYYKCFFFIFFFFFLEIRRWQ